MPRSLERFGPSATLRDGRPCLVPRSERELVEGLHALGSLRARLGVDAELSLEALARIGPVSLRSMLIEAEAGARVEAVEAELLRHQLTLGALGPLPPSLTVGDLLEGPHAGLRAIAGGRLERVAARVEGVLVDGFRVVSSVGPRAAAGPDLGALFFGAQGRLGRLVRATLRAFPRPLAEGSVTVCAEGVAPALALVHQALSRGGCPARLHASATQGQVRLQFVFQGSSAAVDRDRALVERVFPRAPASAPAAAPPGPLREATWDDVAVSLEAGAALSLHRVSLDTVLAEGAVAGRPVEASAPWAAGAASLALAFDPQGVLGGAP
jgi:FAD/FMN-containing dehydrogenase